MLNLFDIEVENNIHEKKQKNIFYGLNSKYSQ